jgi:hypothetical protein
MKFKMAATAGLSFTLDPMGKMFQNASSLKPLGQLNPNCPGMIIPMYTHMDSLALIIFVVSKKKAFEYFPIGSNVNLCPAVVAILVGSRDHRTKNYKGAIQGPFHHSLVAIGPVVSEEKIKM